MLPEINPTDSRRWLFAALFTVTVLAISAVWAFYSPQPGLIFAAGFAFFLLLARFADCSVSQRYLYGALALGAIVAGQLLCPLDFKALQHVVFNTPFLSAYLLPSFWPGTVISIVFGVLLALAALDASIPFASFWEAIVGVMLLPLILHSLAHLIEGLRKERQELHNEIAAKERIARELQALTEELARKNNELTFALRKLEQTQQHMINQEKMASIGQLAAGVAHEINNPLGFVITNVEVLEHYFTAFCSVLARYRELRGRLAETGGESYADDIALLKKSEKDHALDYIIGDFPDLFNDTAQGLKRIGKIVEGMRHFSRVEQQKAFKPYDLAAGLESALLVAYNEIKHCAEVEKRIAYVPPIEAISSEIDQVLLNLLINAAHAIVTKGKDGTGLIRIAAWSETDYVYCSIEDDGIGIASENLGSIFNPFFTTKPVGEGTGMGLSISYEIIVNHHNGKITVESVEGQGAKFVVKLPVRQGGEAAGNVKKLAAN